MVTMQSQSEKPKKAPRKHVTTACVPCRESKIRVSLLLFPSRPLVVLTTSSVTVLLPIVTIAREKGRIAGTSMAMTNGSRCRLAPSFQAFWLVFVICTLCFSSRAPLDRDERQADSRFWPRLRKAHCRVFFEEDPMETDRPEPESRFVLLRSSFPPELTSFVSSSMTMG